MTSVSNDGSSGGLERDTDWPVPIDSDGDDPYCLAVVGTGTGVGKTVVTAGLTRWLRSDGVDARALKPAQTGHPPDDDAGFVAAACGEAEPEEAATCLRYLEPPLAPRVAAEVTGESLEYDSLVNDCRSALSDCEVGLVEGIGGLRVPLAGDAEVIDLVTELADEAVVVARSGLGTLNHSALSVTALERRGVPVRAIVCNEYTAGTTAEETNPTELERMTGVPVVTVPPLEDAAPTAMADGVRAALADAAPFEDRG